MACMRDCAVSNAACMLCKMVWAHTCGLAICTLNLLSLNCLCIGFVSTLAYSSFKLMVCIISQVCCAAAGAVLVLNEHAGNNVCADRDSIL